MQYPVHLFLKLDIKLANWHFGPEKELWVFIDLHFCSTKVHTHFDFIQKMFKNIFCKINVSSWATKESTRIYEVSPWGLNWMLWQPLGYSKKNESICFYNATTIPSVMQWEIVPSLCTPKGCCKKLFVTQLILIKLFGDKMKKTWYNRYPKLIAAFLSSSRFAFEIVELAIHLQWRLKVQNTT